MASELWSALAKPTFISTKQLYKYSGLCTVYSTGIGKDVKLLSAAIECDYNFISLVSHKFLYT